MIISLVFRMLIIIKKFALLACKANFFITSNILYLMRG